MASSTRWRCAIASLDKRAIADTKRLVDVASLPFDGGTKLEWDFIHCRARTPRRPEADQGARGGALSPKNGRIPVPQGPGLGIDPDPDVIKTYRLI
jgi:L-alanine-DL-glutamate epimerase-like enolase superfamily enzyme